MSTALNKFGASESAEEESIDVGGGEAGDTTTTTTVENVVEASLKRTFLESFGVDQGEAGHEEAQRRSFKLYKPDPEDPNNPTGPLSTNPNLRNFGPFYQLRDLETEHKGGIVLTKSSDEKSLRLTVGGVYREEVPARSTTVDRPKYTAVYRLTQTVNQQFAKAYAGYPELETHFFSFLQSGNEHDFSLALVGQTDFPIASMTSPEYLYKSLFRVKGYFAEGSTDDVKYVINDFDLHYYGSLRGELRRKADNSLVSNPDIVATEDDPEAKKISVSEFLNTSNYFYVVYTDGESSDFGLGDGAKTDYKFDIWLADQTLNDATAQTVEQQIGPDFTDVTVSGTKTLPWATLPKQVYDLEVAIEQLTGETVAAVQEQENTQNARLDAAEAAIVNLNTETGLDVRPAQTEEFPDVRLHERFRYLDRLVRGGGADETLKPFFTTNVFSPNVFDSTLSGVFSLPIPTILKDGPDGPRLTEIQRLFAPSSLLTQGALGLLWTAIVPELQTRMAQLTTFPPYRELRGFFKVGNSDYADLPSEPLETLLTRAISAYNAVPEPRLYYIPHTTPNLALFRPHEFDAGAEVMRLYYSDPEAPQAVSEYTFDLVRTRELLPKGFQLLEYNSENKQFHVVPTAIDPTQNHVSHNFLPLDIYSKRSGPNHFIRYIPYVDTSVEPEQMVDQPFNNVIFALEQKKYYYLNEQTEREARAIDVRGGLDTASTRLDRLETELDPVYSALRGLHDRVSSIEHWREAR